jgi:hypothetical protein
MRLTRRGKVLALLLLFTVGLLIGVWSAPYNIKYTDGVSVVDTRNTDR